MYINQLQIQNFRNIHKASIDFSDSKNIIIGLNGNGKSTVLKAINFVFSFKSVTKCNRSELIYKQQDTLTATVSIQLILENNEVEIFNAYYPDHQFSNVVRIERSVSLYDEQIKINGVKASLLSLENLFLNNQLISPLFYIEQGSAINSLTEINDNEKFELLKKSCIVQGVEKDIKENIKTLNSSRAFFAENSEFLTALEHKIRKYRKMKNYKQEYDSLELERNDLETRLKQYELSELQSQLKADDEKENKDIHDLRNKLNELKKDTKDHGLMNLDGFEGENEQLESLKHKLNEKQGALKDRIQKIEQLEYHINEQKKKLNHLIVEKKAHDILQHQMTEIKSRSEYEVVQKEIEKIKKNLNVPKKSKSFEFSSFIDKRKLLWAGMKDFKVKLKKEENLLKKFKLRWRLIDKQDVGVEFKYVYELLEVPEDLQLAVSAVVGNLLFAPVVQTEVEALKLINNFKNINVICMERINSEQRSLMKYEDLIPLKKLVKVTEGYENLIDLIFKEYFLVSDLNNGLALLAKLKNNEIPKNVLRGTTLKNIKLVTLPGEKLRHGEIQTNFANYGKSVYLPLQLREIEQNISDLEEKLIHCARDIQTLTIRINEYASGSYDTNQDIDKEQEDKINIRVLENRLKIFDWKKINGDFSAIPLLKMDISDNSNKIEVFKKDLEHEYMSFNGLEETIHKHEHDLGKIKKAIEIGKNISELESKVGESDKIDIAKQLKALERNKIIDRAQKLKRELGNIRSTADKNPLNVEKCKRKLEIVIEKLSKFQIVGEKNEFSDNIKKIDTNELEKGQEIFSSYEEFYKKNEELKQTSSELQDFINKLMKQKQKIFNSFIMRFKENFEKIIKVLPFPVSFVINNNDGEEEINLNGERLSYLQKPGRFTIKDLNSFSGGQKSLLTLIFIMALQLTQPSSFYLFDEVDAAIDKTNREIFLKIIQRIYSEKTLESQLFMITFNSDMLRLGDKIFEVVDGNVSEVSLEQASGLLNWRTNHKEIFIFWRDLVIIFVQSTGQKKI